MTTRTVIGQYLNVDGTPVRGYLEFKPSSTIAQSAIIPVSTVRVVLDETGSFSTVLQVTDEPGFIPTGWLWSVEEKIPNGNQWYLEVLTSESPLDIANSYVIGSNGGPYYAVQGANTEHGLLVGLADNDHPQYVLKAGDTMTGSLTISPEAGGGTLSIFDPVAELGFRLESYPGLPSHAALVTLPSGNVTGIRLEQVDLISAPIIGTHAATKTYVDELIVFGTHTNGTTDANGYIAIPDVPDGATVFCVTPKGTAGIQINMSPSTANTVYVMNSAGAAYVNQPNITYNWIARQGS